ncbi:MAG TPA: GreA/GreB family elongation factor, partial [Dongiaceae bacterium]|nr:GreA/GreB family elongation factor [Dongiaceae bacterium]
LTALTNLVENARAAMIRAYESATHEENIAENKYDTLGLEAAYLTQGQARRLEECEADLAAFNGITPKAFTEDDAISLGALVAIENDKGESQYLFFGPAAGGLKIAFNGADIVVVTASAPIGKALLKAQVGDSITVQTGAGQKVYDVVAIC